MLLFSFTHLNQLIMTDKEKIAQLEDTLKNVLKAYDIIEEYVCLLVCHLLQLETQTQRYPIFLCGFFLFACWLPLHEQQSYYLQAY